MDLRLLFLGKTEKPQMYLPLFFNFVLNTMGFGLFIPLIPILFIDPASGFFGRADLPEALLITGSFIGCFGLAQLLGVPMVRKGGELYGYRAVLLSTTLVSFLGYVLLTGAIYQKSVILFFLGRVLTGLGAANTKVSLIRSWDAHPQEAHTHLLNHLLGIGALSFFLGPLVGAKLMESSFLGWMTPTLFFAIFYAVNFLFLLLYTPKKKAKRGHRSFLIEILSEFLTLITLLRYHRLWAVFFIFLSAWILLFFSFPSFLLQNYGLGWSTVSDLFAYISVFWFLGVVFFGPELQGKISGAKLARWGLFLAAIGVLCIPFIEHLFWFWFLVPIIIVSASLVWSNVEQVGYFGFFKEIRQKVLSLVLTLFSLALTLAPILGGLIVGLRTTYGLYLVSLLFFAAGCLIVFYKEKALRSKGS
jgi:MFS family permease